MIKIACCGVLSEKYNILLNDLYMEPVTYKAVGRFARKIPDMQSLNHLEKCETKEKDTEDSSKF